MSSSSRYFATVRRATFNPSDRSISAICLSERGLAVSSFEMKSFIFSIMLLFESTSPSSALNPVEKKYLNSRRPFGDCMYLLAMARLTVVSWMSI